MLKVIYAGTPEFALPALAELLRSEHQVVAVYTQPDRPAGRGRKMQSGPVKRLALEHALPVYQPSNFKSVDTLQQLRQLDADLMVVAAYGILLPPAVLDAPRLGCVNIHASLLPRWRGASPIQQAILAGDEETGITLMQMQAGLDSGPIIERRSLAIDGEWSAAELHDRLAPLGAELLGETLGDIEAALAGARAQDASLVTCAPRLEKQQAEVDWDRPLVQLLREIRAFNPWPVSYSFLDGDSLRLWRARAASGVAAQAPGQIVAHDKQGVYVGCADGVLQVTELQFAGRSRCGAAEALNRRDLSGCRLGRKR